MQYATTKGIVPYDKDLGFTVPLLGKKIWYARMKENVAYDTDLSLLSVFITTMDCELHNFCYISKTALVLTEIYRPVQTLQKDILEEKCCFADVSTYSPLEITILEDENKHGNVEVSLLTTGHVTPTVKLSTLSVILPLALACQY
ncbi:hypothetical protein BKA83DRAFT_4127544 [Pisolithus microcarpus]|nr:hypothetical protein BKA83DRAFT_4127544 [Pisolithus microcarpus]